MSQINNILQLAVKIFEREIQSLIDKNNNVDLVDDDDEKSEDYLLEDLLPVYEKNIHINIIPHQINMVDVSVNYDLGYGTGYSIGKFISSNEGGGEFYISTSSESINTALDSLEEYLSQILGS